MQMQYFYDQYFYDDEKNYYAIKESIDTAKRRLKKTELDIEDIRNVYRLLEQDYIRVCKTPKTRYDYVSDIFSNAFSEQHNKKKSERKNFELLKSMIISDFFKDKEPKDIQLSEIVSCGYESYAYSVHIKYRDYEFTFDFPILKNMNRHNATYTDYGMISVCRKYNSHREVIIREYFVEDIIPKLNDYFAKNGIE